MRPDRARWSIVLAAGVLAGAAACDDDASGAPRLAPAVVWVGDQDRGFGVEGLNPVAYLRGADGEVRLIDDFAATIGEVATTVVGVDGAGVEVTLRVPLPVGVYPLTVTAGDRTWHTEAALTVVDEPLDAGGGCPAAPVGCTAFTCPPSTHCYYVCAERAWSAAENQCPALGLGCLVTISDRAESDCVAAATNPVASAAIWTGWHQAIGSPEPAGGWGWACPDGSTYMAPGWGGVEPDDQGGEDCGALGADGALSDLGCNLNRRFVCEL